VADEDHLVAGRYRLTVRAGSGAMGVVWQARDERLDRTVAVKQVLIDPRADDDARELANRRVMREARITARLHHPSAITVYDVVEHEGYPCLIMEYLPSRSLAAVLTERTTLPAVEVAAIGRQVADALLAAHAAGIVHRDVKPANVLIDEKGRTKITDFGISRAAGDVTLTATGMVAGTPAYLAPEIARGSTAGFASDVYSLGSTLYAALEGTPPFGHYENALPLLHRVASGDIVPPQRSGPLTSLLQRLLEHEPSRRPPLEQVRNELERVASEATEAPTTPGPAAVATEPVSPRPATAALPMTPVRDDPPADAARRPLRAAVSLAPPAAPPESPPTAPPAARPTSAPPPSPPPRAPRRRRGALIAGAVAVVAAAGIVIALVSGLGSGGSASPGAAAPPAGSTAGSSPAEAPTSTAAQGAPGDSSATTGANAPASSGSPVQRQQQDAVTGYYALIPSQLPQGWGQLTPSYQQKTAGGYAGYERFWGAVRQVSVTDVSSPSEGSVQATVTYTSQGGQVSREETLFRMVLVDGVWKIDESRVLSSR